MRRIWVIASIALLAVLLSVPFGGAGTWTLTVSSTASDGGIFMHHESYTTAHDNSGGTVSDDENYFYIGQENSTGDSYSIWRGFVFFDTSPIPDGADIYSATLSLYGIEDTSDVDFDVVVQYGGATYPHAPLEEGDYDRTHYAGNGGSLNTSDFVVGGYNDIELNAVGRSWINTAGATKLCLRSSRDISGTAPGENTSEYVDVSTKEFTLEGDLEIKYHSGPPFEDDGGLIDNDSFMDWLAGPITNIIGDTFWIILLMVVIGLVWFKTKHIGATWSVAIIGFAVFSRIFYSPILQTMFMWFAVLGVAIGLFRIVVRVR